MKGRVQIERVGSAVLRDNFLGDPHLRDVVVYLPPGYGEDRKARYPVLYFLPGFTGTPLRSINSSPWQENIVERLDRLVVSGRALPCLFVIPDCFTRYGGSQYVDSVGTGRYEEHIVGELVPYIDSKFATRAGRDHRAVMGKSSGGFGTLWLASRHPGVFAHAACHSGDMLFETCYGRDVGPCVNQLEAYGGRFERFVAEFNRAPARKRGDFPHEAINMAGMSSCYSPDPRSRLGFELPFDERTGELRQAVWRRWLAYDPVRWASARAAALKSLSTLFFDCGRKDEFYLHLGARVLARELKRLGVRHRCEEHGFGHMNMADRYDVSLPLLTRAASK
ncbi:MAG: alpha/beta hydrolase-fold protein [Elusimicrobia bacterium]|nr:alpha/beta hydrolase-fold protein [Elusimicrobiota bacterium]